MGSSFHVDFVLRTPRGAVVLDLRDVRGNVFGGDQMNEWTVMDGPHRYTFVNPQSALYDRIAAVKAIAGDDMPVEGRIVFTRRARFPKGLPKHTLMLDSLPRDFPLIEGGTPGGADPFDQPWANLRQAVRPSLMAQARPVEPEQGAARTALAAALSCSRSRPRARATVAAIWRKYMGSLRRETGRGARSRGSR